MQTFLPSSDYYESARMLDYRRLGKQRVEVLQILRALMGKTNGWRNHPAVRMWRGYERELVTYGDAICSEWIQRGYKDTCRRKILELDLELEAQGVDFVDPPWLGSPEFHASHRAALKAKDPDYYGQFGWSEEAGIDYVWPGG